MTFFAMRRCGNLNKSQQNTLKILFASEHVLSYVQEFFSEHQTEGRKEVTVLPMMNGTAESPWLLELSDLYIDLLMFYHSPLKKLIVPKEIS